MATEDLFINVEKNAGALHVVLEVLNSDATMVHRRRVAMPETAGTHTVPIARPAGEEASFFSILEIDDSPLHSLIRFGSNIPLAEFANECFRLCRSLVEITQLDASRVISAVCLFSNCSSLTTLPPQMLESFRPVNAAFVFCGCTSLVVAPQIDTSRATTVRGMFRECDSLVDVPHFNLSCATDVSHMFKLCERITTVPHFDLSHVTNASGMFFRCVSLREIPSFNLRCATTVSHMFKGCERITTVPHFDLPCATNAMSMFEGCSSLIAVSPFNVPHLVYAESMFEGCTSLTEKPQLLNLPDGAMIERMFFGCHFMTPLLLPVCPEFAYDVVSPPPDDAPPPPDELCFNPITLEETTVSTFIATAAAAPSTIIISSGRHFGFLISDLHEINRLQQTFKVATTKYVVFNALPTGEVAIPSVNWFEFLRAVSAGGGVLMSRLVILADTATGVRHCSRGYPIAVLRRVTV